MTAEDKQPLVFTIKERCRMCYTCVRECPAKAIRITDGQAEVVSERCIACGNCVRVCNQKAKQVRSSTDLVTSLFSKGKTVAMVAPSFPAEFEELDYRVLVGMIKSLGFYRVNEVAYGADLTAVAYKELLEKNPDKSFIATSCPALVSFVEKFHPGLVKYLSPIISPMIAQARVMKKMYGPEINLVFIGPCIAKKDEAECPDLNGEVDAVLTFCELREMFVAEGIKSLNVEPEEFDPPVPGLGMLYPVSRGSLEAAGLEDSVLYGKVIAADGRADFQEAIKEIYYLEANLLEILCCKGCIMGPGMTTRAPYFRRRADICKYTDKRFRQQDVENASGQITEDIDLQRCFTPNDKRIPDPTLKEIKEILKRLGKEKPEDELDCGACGYDTCRAHVIAIHKGLAENEMCLPYTIERLNRTVEELADSNQHLASTQAALMQAERLASMGQLAAGIAHEVNNPLGAVLLYAHMLLDEADRDSEIFMDLKTIVDEADRCKKIVSGLLDFARKNKVALQVVNVTSLLDKSLDVALHSETVTVTIEHEEPGLKVEVDPDQLVQVITNLFKNSLDAMPDGGQLTVHTGKVDKWFMIEVEDQGIGIPPENLKRVFDPFFTTKKMGQGTGLGLAVIYGIIKMHKGQVDVDSNCDPEQGPTGTKFTIRLPISHQQSEQG